MRLIVFGAGYSGRVILTEMAGYCDAMAGTTRSFNQFAAIAATGATPLEYAGAGFGPELVEAMATATHLVMSIAPDADAGTESGDPLLKDLEAGLRSRMPDLRWTGYLSTVGVYGDHDGEWVDETTECRPVSRRSMARKRAEEAWQSACDEAGVPLAILRLSGIYGPGRNAFCNLERGTARRLVKPGQVFNRIHVDDIAGATGLLARRELEGIFNITDDCPAPPQDVVAEAARLMGVAPPPETDFETADLTPMARSFYGENKRVSNARIKAAGYRFRWPNYRAALAGMWADGLWKS